MRTQHLNFATSENSKGIQIRSVLTTEIPQEGARGRLGFIVSSPFWPELVEKLNRGLSPMEAVEIELSPVKNALGKIVTPKQELASIRHEFSKSGLSKKYSLLVRGNGTSRLFVTSRDTESAVVNGVVL